MPAKPTWLLHIPTIIQQLQALDAPVVDRRICERLFGVRRRRAITLMQQFGGYKSGNTALVDRIAMISKLADIEQTAEYSYESTRKQKLSDKLDQLHRCKAATKIRLPVSVMAQHNMLTDLPPGITLSPGKLVIEFTAPEELFAKLYELAQAATNDFDRICDVVATLNSSQSQTNLIPTSINSYVAFP
jgi:hypothetical protein